MAKAKVRRGAARVHAPLSVPFPETQVRFAASAGTAERPEARRAPAMVGTDAIYVMVCPPSNAGALPEQHTTNDTPSFQTEYFLGAFARNRPEDRRRRYGQVNRDRQVSFRSKHGRSRTLL